MLSAKKEKRVRAEQTNENQRNESERMERTNDRECEIGGIGQKRAKESERKRFARIKRIQHTPGA